MICPRCQSENRAGAATCATCGRSLPGAEGAAGEDEAPVELVSILASSNARRYLAARALLDGARLAHVSRGDGLRELFAVDSRPAGRLRSERIAGPVEILVRKQDAAAAARLLAALDGDAKKEAAERGTPAP